MPCDRIPDAAVELLEVLGFLVEPVLVQHIEDLLHGAGDGVLVDELVSFEEGLEHRARDDVAGPASRWRPVR